MPIDRSRPRRLPWARVSSFVALPLALAWAAACSSTHASLQTDTPQAASAGETRDVEIKHETCDAAGKEAKTYKGEGGLASGKSFVTRVFASGREVCSFADLNGDGNVDVFTYFAPDGRVRRREAAYTVGKSVDEIAVYANGEVAVVMRETNFDGKLDTWDYYEGGKLVRRERDKNGDGRIDEWWSFEPGTENATIVQADARSGKPDPTSTVKLGIGGGTMGGLGAAKPAASASASATASAAPSAAASGSAPKDAGPEAADASPSDPAKPASPAASTKPGKKGGK